MFHRLALNSIPALPTPVARGDALPKFQEPIGSSPGCSRNNDFVAFAIDEADGFGCLFPIHRLVHAQGQGHATALKQLDASKALPCIVPEWSLAQWLCAQCGDEGVGEGIDELSRSVPIAHQCSESGEARNSPARSKAFTLAPKCRNRLLLVPVCENLAQVITRTALRGWIASQRGNVGMDLHCEGPAQNSPGGGGGLES